MQRLLLLQATWVFGDASVARRIWREGYMQGMEKDGKWVPALESANKLVKLLNEDTVENLFDVRDDV